MFDREYGANRTKGEQSVESHRIHNVRESCRTDIGLCKTLLQSKIRKLQNSLAVKGVSRQTLGLLCRECRSW